MKQNIFKTQNKYPFVYTEKVLKELLRAVYLKTETHNYRLNGLKDHDVELF